MTKHTGRGLKQSRRDVIEEAVLVICPRELPCLRSVS